MRGEHVEWTRHRDAADFACLAQRLNGRQDPRLCVEHDNVKPIAGDYVPVRALAGLPVVLDIPFPSRRWIGHNSHASQCRSRVHSQ